MTVTVPATEKTGAYFNQQQIAKLAAVPASAPYASQAAQLKNQTEIELVNTLLDQRKLNAATILSTYTGTRNPLAAKITILTAQVASLGTATSAGAMAAAELDQTQRSAVGELMANGQILAASILSSQSYIGPPAQ